MRNPWFIDDWTVIGHRACRDQVPENSLAAVDRALSDGVHHIEVDVWLVESQLLVLHDRRLGPSGELLVSSASISELRRHCEAPLLSDLMDRWGDRPINIELKHAAAVPVLVDYLQDRCSTGKAKFENILVSSFDHHALSAVRQHDTQINLAALIAGNPLSLAADAQALGAIALNVSVDCVTPELIKDAHRRGLRVLVYTVNHLDDAMTLREWGADGIFTDFPQRFNSQRA